ncbi:hypothetical protein AB0C90_40050 [Streptomyces sp. NPDC048550]
MIKRHDGHLLDGPVLYLLIIGIAVFAVALVYLVVHLRRSGRHHRPLR